MQRLAHSLPAIRASCLNKEMSGITIISGASLSVQQGEAVAVVGPSGSGKSTLMALIGLLTTATSGDLEVMGHFVGRSSRGMRNVRRKGFVAWVPQLPLILPGRTVFENAVLPRRLSGSLSPEAILRIHELLEVTGLNAVSNRNASVLSGGELQRLGVVRALGAGSPIVVADEPTASLDSVNTTSVIDALVQNRGNVTVVVASHDSRVANACSRHIQLIDGRVVGDWQADSELP